MRILHWYPNFLGGGGVANAVHDLATAQARLGADVVIATASARGKRLYGAPTAGPVAIHEWHPSLTVRRGGLTLRRLSSRDARALHALEPDLVHVHGEFNPDNLRVPRLFACPIVLSPHGAFHPVVLSKSRPAGKRAYAALARPLLYRHAVVHALSPQEADDVRRLVPSARTYCAPSGSRSRTQLTTRLAPGAARFLFVGRLDVHTKGLDLLLDAFAETRRELPDVRLTLAGPDWNGGRRTLVEHARSLGVLDALRLPGELTRAQVRAELDACDVYVQLSRHEGFPLGVADALAAGKPAVLSSAIGTVSYPELAALSHVVVVDPHRAAGALARAARDLDALRRSAVQAAPELDSFFSWERVARLHLERYAALTESVATTRTVAAVA